MNDWLAERVLLEEVPESRRADVAAARGTPRLDDRLAALRASNADILADMPSERVAAEVARRVAATTAARRRRWVMWTAPLAAAAAAVVVVMLRPGTAAVTDHYGERLKGDARLEIYRKVGDGSVRLRAGATAAAGDRLQLSYVAAGKPYGVILSIDGRGSVTVHHPAAGGVAAPLEQGGAKSLRFGYELDDAPQFERFVLVTADAPFAVDIAATAAHRVARDPRRARTQPLALPAGLAQATYVVTKRGPIQ